MHTRGVWKQAQNEMSKESVEDVGPPASLLMCVCVYIFICVILRVSQQHARSNPPTYAYIIPDLTG